MQLVVVKLAANGDPAMKYDAVIFDLFGTLVDDPAHPEHLGVEYRRMISEVAATLSIGETEFRRLWSETGNERYAGTYPTMDAYLEYICRESGVRPQPDRISLASRLRLDYFRGALTPRDDTLATLAQLKAAGHKIGLISDCSVEVSILWPGTPFAPLMDVAIRSCDVGVRKPAPRIYQMVLEGLGATPE